MEILVTRYFRRRETSSEIKMNETGCFEGKRNKYPEQKTHYAKGVETLG